MSLNIDGTAKVCYRSADYAPTATSSTRPVRTFRPSLWPTIAAALFIPLFLAAGQWQWNKAELKAERRQQLDARGAQSALAVPATLADAEALNYRKLVAQGRYEPQFQILIDNRTHNGQAGYHVVTPLHVNGSDVRLLVNRGWITAPADRQQIPSFDTPTDSVQLSGTAVIPPARFFTLASRENSGQEWQRVWQNLDLERYRASVGFPVQPVVLQLDPPNTARESSGGFVREWGRPDDKRLINVGYALQWWTFAATTFVLWIVLSFRRQPALPPSA